MILDGYYASLALLVAPALAVVVLGTLVIRLIARAAERRVAAARRWRYVTPGWGYPSEGRPLMKSDISPVNVGEDGAVFPVIEPLPRASLRPFAAWIAWAFVSGLVVALLAQRAVGS
jgi:hypothetical protein